MTDGDAGSSSYELKAITDDFGAATGVVHASHLWGDRLDHDYDDHDELATPSLKQLPGAASSSVAPAGSQLSRFGADATHNSRMREPWYARVLQIWGIALLLWALLIMARSLLPMLLFGDGPRQSSEVISAVIPVLLLVPGAAALFLVVDFRRFMRRRFQAGDTHEQSSRPTGPTTLNLRTRRLWQRPLRTAPSVRP
jgi:hypothetical protein